MSNHATLALLNNLVAARGTTWQHRGYQLGADNGSYRIEGDLGQFYLDAVSRDADAHLALEFLRQQGAPDWGEIVEMAEDDGIDLSESQEIFLMGISLDEHVARL